MFEKEKNIILLFYVPFLCISKRLWWKILVVVYQFTKIDDDTVKSTYSTSAVQRLAGRWRTNAVAWIFFRSLTRTARTLSITTEVPWLSYRSLLILFHLLGTIFPVYVHLIFDVLYLVEFDIFSSLKCLVWNFENVVYFKPEFHRLQQAEIPKFKVEKKLKLSRHEFF